MYNFIRPMDVCRIFGKKNTRPWADWIINRAQNAARKENHASVRPYTDDRALLSILIVAA